MSIILKYLITFFVGMVPILELRGAIPIGVGLGLSYFEAFICSFIGNIIPIYFIVKYIFLALSGVIILINMWFIFE